MIKSEIFRGKIYAGDTAFSSTIEVEQTGDMEITVHAGEFTTTGDTGKQELPAHYVLEEDAVFSDLLPNPTRVKYYQAELGLLDGKVDVLMRSRLDAFYPPVPEGWQTIHILIFDFPVYPDTTKLDDIDISVLTVLPGFPPGTTADDWRIQTGKSQIDVPE